MVRVSNENELYSKVSRIKNASRQSFFVNANASQAAMQPLLIWSLCT